MARKFSELYWLRHRARILNAGLSSRLGEYLADYPTDTPRELIHVIREILKCVSDRIEHATDDRYLASYCHLVQGLATMLVYFDNAHTEQTPRALPQMLEDLTRHISKDAKLVVWPQAEYNFSIGDVLPWLKKLVENVLTAEEKVRLFAPFTGPVNLVSFPRIERDNIFVHAIFGHELGHPIAEEYLSSEKGTPKYLSQLVAARAQLAKLFAAEITARKNPLARLGYEKQLIQAVLAVRQRGLQELISDVVAVLLFGPSALFAALEVFASDTLDDVPQHPSYYPPSRMRFRIMWNVLESQGFVEAIKALRDRGIRESAEEIFDHVENLIAIKDDEKAIQGEKIASVAYDWVAQSVTEATTFSKGRLVDTLYSDRAIALDIPELVARIELNIPPNETGSYPHTSIVDWRSSMLAAWLHRLRRASEEVNFSDPFPMREFVDLQEITMHAVESTLLAARHSEWVKTKVAGP